MKRLRSRSVPAEDADSGAVSRRGTLRPRVGVTFEGTVFAWFTALFAFAALVFQENLVFLLGCAAFASGQAARLLARRNLQGLRVWREAPSRARAGFQIPVTYGLANPRRRPAVGVEIRDRLGPQVRPGTLALDLAGLEGGGVVRHTTRVVFARRGLHRLGGLSVASRFPLAFFRATADANLATDEVLVRPHEGRSTPKLRALLGGRAAARRRPSLIERGDDALHGIREFRDGDDPRRIHWRTSARRGVLTVSQWRREQGRHVVLILGRGRGAGRAAGRIFERAVSAVATMWRSSHRLGLEGSLELGAGRGTRTSARSRRLAQGLDALARVRPQAGRTPRAALRHLAARPGSRIVIFVATAREPGIRRRLAAAAGRNGTWLCLRADRDDLSRWVRDLR